MKFLSYKNATGIRLGLMNEAESHIIDIYNAGQALGYKSAPSTMLELIEQGEESLAIAKRLLAEKDLAQYSVAVNSVEICAPIPRPRKNVFAIGLNYVKHNQEFTGSSKLPEHPIVFTKAPTTVIATKETIRLRPDLTPQVDYEGELGVIIGKKGSDISPDQAEDFIFGYTIINDVTARDLQKRTGQWFMGKSLDTFCPMGPYIVHKSAVGWPVKLDIKTTINDEVRQSSNTEHLYFGIPALLAAVSAGVTLEPGDIIATGTPEGVGMAFDPPKFLKSGDTATVEIEGLGVLINPVA